MNPHFVAPYIFVIIALGGFIINSLLYAEFRDDRSARLAFLYLIWPVAMWFPVIRFIKEMWQHARRSSKRQKENT